MQLSDFDFDLPDALIATRPANPRTSARLLVARGDAFTDGIVQDLADILQKGDLLVLNNTRVLPARLDGLRIRGPGAVAKIEITLMDPLADGGWRALAKPLRKLAMGEEITFSDTLHAHVTRRGETDLDLAFNLEGDALSAALETFGKMPLPPYIAAKRPTDARDLTDYQTVFAKSPGAVAAPTASLHFDAALLAALADKGVEQVEVTLHVGAGTFLPVKVDDVKTHRMHSEWGEVSAKAAQQINQAKAEGRRVIAVGTTALRLIESAARDGKVRPFRGTTDIFIYPGFQFQITSGLMTNFHLPKSTLLMLVSALMGKDRMDRIYAHAIRNGYRFFSYGDSSLLLPDRGGMSPKVR